MNASKLERLLLLEQTGELTKRQSRLLEQELARSDEARALKQELGAFKGAVKMPVEEPSPWAVTRIQAELRGWEKPLLLSARILKPAAAVAACLLVAATAIFDFQNGKPAAVTSETARATTVTAVDEVILADPLSADLGELEDLILAISGDPLDIMEI